MQTAHELFLHELSDMLDAERKFLEITNTFAQEATNPQLKKTMEQHYAQTEKQIERLQQCFEELGEQPEDTECAGVKGLVEEHENFSKEEPSEDILQVFNVAAGIKGERYEISAYESLIRLGTMMEHKKAVRLLQQNLREEQQTLKKLDSFAKKIQPENMGMEEEEQAEEVTQSSRRSSRGSRSSSRSRRAA